MNPPNKIFTRRSMLGSMMGSSSLLFPGLLQPLFGNPGYSGGSPLDPRSSPLTPKAKRVIFVFFTGGMSHIDTFDPKPADKGRDGFERDDKLMGSIVPSRPDPVTGIETTDLFPHFRNCLQDVTLIRSMKASHFDHGEATMGMHTGLSQESRPSIGSWMSYGLGSENSNLPSFVVLAPHLPYSGTRVYQSDFLPAVHQGTRIVPGSEPIPDLTPRSREAGVQQAELNLTQQLNQSHLSEAMNDTNLAARIQSFETAFRMQMTAPEALDLDSEPDYVKKAYGLDQKHTHEFAWQCLAGRRLAERGVRFIELIHRGSDLDSNWDNHLDMNAHKDLAASADQPLAALLRDLKLRGMLEDTLVVGATEFGRTPFRDQKYGRHHHNKCFSMWIAGGGFKAGHVHGSTDERGFDIAEGTVDVHDLHATMLHQLGFDHEKLTYRHGGRDYRLTDVHGTVRDELLA